MMLETSLPMLYDLSVFKFMAEPTIELEPELAVDPPPPVPTGLALMMPVIICGGRKSLLMSFSRTSCSYLLHTYSLVLLDPTPTRKYCWYMSMDWLLLLCTSSTLDWDIYCLLAYRRRGALSSCVCSGWGYQLLFVGIRINLETMELEQMNSAHFIALVGNLSDFADHFLSPYLRSSIVYQLNKLRCFDFIIIIGFI